MNVLLINNLFLKELFENKFDPRLIRTACSVLNTELRSLSIFHNSGFTNSDLRHSFDKIDDTHKVGNYPSDYNIQYLYSSSFFKISKI